MNKILIAFFVVAPAIALGQATPATPAVPASDGGQRQDIVNKRQENQQNRIDAGVKDGSLNEKEAQRLQKRQDRIQKAEDKAMADGKMNKKEFRKIEKMQNHSSRDIHRQRHDRQGRRANK